VLNRQLFKGGVYFLSGAKLIMNAEKLDFQIGRASHGISICVKPSEWEQLGIRADFRPSRLAELCGKSERQLQRFFKIEMQTTPGKWLRKLRCRLAKRLLEQGFSTKSIAYDLKYAHPSHFCREFKAMFNSSPQSLLSKEAIETHLDGFLL